MANKNTTETATLLVCQCQGSHFTVKKQTRSSVSLVCGKCGLTASVKGHIADAEVLLAELAAARLHIVGPDPNATPSRKGKKEAAEPDEKFVNVRARMTQPQRDLLYRAAEAVRLMNSGNPELAGQQWLGTAIELMAADFLSGVDPVVLGTIDAAAQAETEAAAQAVASGPKSERAIRRARAKARAEVLEKAASVEYKPEETPTDEAIKKGKQEYEEVQAKAAKKEAEDDRVVDDGRLIKAVRETLVEYASAFKERNGKALKMLVDEAAALPELQAHWNKNGGYLLRVDGDERTRTATGVLPRVVFWIADEDPDETIDFAIEYDEAFDDMVSCPHLAVVELLPAGFNKLPEEEQWEPPAVAERREVMR